MMDGITEFGTLCDLGHSVTLVIIYSDIVIYLYSGKGCALNGQDRQNEKTKRSK